MFMVFSLTMDCFASLSIPEMVRAFIIWLIFITLIFFFFFFKYLPYLFQMLSPFLFYQTKNTPILSPLFLPSNTPSPGSLFHNTWSSSLLRTTDLSSGWYPTRPSNSTYIPGALGPAISTLFLYEICILCISLIWRKMEKLRALKQWLHSNVSSSVNYTTLALWTRTNRNFQLDNIFG